MYKKITNFLKKLIIIIFFLGIIVFFIGIVSIIVWGIPSQGPGYSSIEKFNILELRKWTLGEDNYLYFYDTIHETSTVEDMIDKYVFIDGFIYEIGKWTGGNTHSTEINGEWETFFDIPTIENGKLKRLYYKKLEDIPKYIKIDSTNGETFLYKDFSEMSDEEMSIFKGLEEGEYD